MSEHPVRLILIGFVLVLAGAVFPLLMVSKVLESTYTASTAGLFLGIIGGAMYVKKTRKPSK
jgi:hypothetical protein